MGRGWWCDKIDMWEGLRRMKGRSWDHGRSGRCWRSGDVCMLIPVGTIWGVSCSEFLMGIDETCGLIKDSYDTSYGLFD